MIAISYEKGGLNLYTFTKWAQWGPGKRWETDPTRSVPALFTLLGDHNNRHQWGGEILPELGDMALWKDLRHSAVVAEILGDTADAMFVIQASYSQGTLNKMSVATWQVPGGGNMYFGHPDPQQRR